MYKRNWTLHNGVELIYLCKSETCCCDYIWNVITVILSSTVLCSCPSQCFTEHTNSMAVKNLLLPLCMFQISRTSENCKLLQFDISDVRIEIPMEITHVISFLQSGLLVAFAETESQFQNIDINKQRPVPSLNCRLYVFWN